MKILLQRVKEANVKVDDKIIGEIGEGLLLFVGFTHDDNEYIIEQMAKKCVELRIFNDEFGKINKSLLDVNGSILSISQFTLYANCLKGRRPSFENSENRPTKTYTISVEENYSASELKLASKPTMPTIELGKMSP